MTTSDDLLRAMVGTSEARTPAELEAEFRTAMEAMGHGDQVQEVLTAVRSLRTKRERELFLIWCEAFSAELDRQIAEQDRLAARTSAARSVKNTQVH